MTLYKDQSEFIPYGKQNITEDDISAVVKVLNSPFLTQGKEVPNFEREISREVNSSFSVAVNSATSALHISCMSLGLTNGDILWTSPITFVASANCGRFCNAEVDFIDIDLSTGLISIPLLREKLVLAKLKNRLPKILVLVHLTGSSCNMEEISKLSKEYNFSIIEDASHALGGSYKNNPVGCCQFSDITVFSFHPVKIITTGEGGIATTNNPDLFKRMTQFRSHGIVRDKDEFQFLTNVPWGYEQQTLGFNYRMNDLQAALGLSQLKRLKKIVRERNKLAMYYKENLPEDKVSLLRVPDEVICSYHLAVIRLKDSTASKHEHLFKFLRKNKIGVQLHYLPVHLHPYFREMGFKEGDYPNAEIYAKSAISLPLYPGLETIQQEYVVKKVTEGLEKI